MERLRGRRTRWYPKHVAALLVVKGLDEDRWEWLAVNYMLRTGRKDVLLAWAQSCLRTVQSAEQGHHAYRASSRIKYILEKLQARGTYPNTDEDRISSIHTLASHACKAGYEKTSSRLYKRLAKLMTESS